MTMGATARALRAAAWLTWASVVSYTAQAQPSALEHFTGMAEASAAAMLDAAHFVVAEDECNVLRVYRAGQAAPVGQPIDLRQFLAAGAKASDIEGAARVGDVIYWISFHSLTGNKGKFQAGRHRFFATAIETGAGAGAAPTVRSFHAEAAMSADSQQLMLLSDDGASNAELACSAAPKAGQRSGRCG